MDLGSAQCCGERASGLTCLEPGWLVRVKLNRLKNGDHRVWPEFSYLASWMLERFLLVGPDHEWLLQAPQPVTPHLRCHLDRQEFPVTDIIVPFSGC